MSWRCLVSSTEPLFPLFFVATTDLVLAIITHVIVLVKTVVTEFFISCDLNFEMNFPLFPFRCKGFFFAEIKISDLAIIFFTRPNGL